MKYLSQILKNLNLDESEIPRIKVHGLSIHSKNVKTGDLFIAIKGNKRNLNKSYLLLFIFHKMFFGFR